jgi:hypothetical protein
MSLEERTPRRPFLLSQPVLRTVSSGKGSRFSWIFAVVESIAADALAIMGSLLAL